MGRDLDIYIIDAFAERPMTGNPAAVCPLDEWIDPTVMQAVAAEMNLSETVFFVDRGSRFEIRWFTPTREVDLIGHATLAAGFLVLSRLRPELEAARFVTPRAELVVSRDAGRLALSMPALPPTPRESARPALEAALGCPVVESHAAMHHLALIESPEALATLRPDMAAVSRLELPAVIVTSAAEGDADFVSRFFAPANGVPEDPVSGVAHCCLAPFWARRLGRSKLVGRQLSARGGVVECRLDGDRVVLAGAAVIFLEGRIHV